MSTEEYIDPDELNEADVPWSGSMPDVSMAYPWSADIFSNPDRPNGAVWPYRLAFGAEDDANRAKVSEWLQVDDLGGITSLWAGVYAGQIFLHAGSSAPTAAEDTDEVDGAFVAAGTEAVWNVGEPVLPYAPVPMEARDGMLKNELGQWRRMVWEPLAIFDIFPDKKTVNETGLWAFTRYTLYCVVEGSWVAFYTTKATSDSGLMADGQPARWPFSYYLSRNKTGNSTYQPGDKDGGVTSGWYDSASNGFRLAPLPWQMDDGELETEETVFVAEGVSNGRRYAFAPAYPCPRYLSTTFDARVTDALNAAALQESGDYKLLSKAEAYDAIIDTIRKAATDGYSIDPGVFEELGREFPDGVLAGSTWTDKPNSYKVIFSYHLDGGTRWPYWLAFIAALSPTAVLTASACRFYNDYEEAEPPDEPGGYYPDNTDPDTDDEETDEDTDPKELELGYYYEAGTGIQMTREWSGKGWKFTVHIDDISGSGIIGYKAALTVSTTNATQTYDWPEGNNGAGIYGLSMYYGVAAYESEIRVSWQSSYQGSDRQPKTATAHVGIGGEFTYSATFDDFIVTSDTPPSFGGNAISAVKTGTIKKRGTYRSWNAFEQKWYTVRYVREFDKYRLSVRTSFLQSVCSAMAINGAPSLPGSASPITLSGQSDDIDGPDVTAGLCVATPNQTEEVPSLFGDVRPSVLAEYESSTATISVRAETNRADGYVYWNSGKKKGTISGSFNLTFTPTTATIE